MSEIVIYSVKLNQCLSILLISFVVYGCKQKIPDVSPPIEFTGEKVWDKSFGGNGSQSLQSVIATSDGGFLLGGYSDSSISADKTQPTNGDTDYWVIKLNFNGEKMWDKSFGGSNYDYLYSMIATPDGGYLLGGNSKSFKSGDKSEDGKGGDDFWVIKITADGQKVWDRTFGGSGVEVLSNVSATTDGGYLLSGFSDSALSSDKTQNSKGVYDFWLIKITATGEKIWDKTYGGRDYELFPRIVVNSDGSYLLGGASKSSSSGDRTQVSKGDYDYWIIKINASGEKIWDRSFGGSANDYLSSLKVTKDGGYLLGGRSESSLSGDKTQDTKGFFDYDCWIVKINAAGEKVWDRSFGGDSYDAIVDIVVNENGYLLCGNSASSVSSDKTMATKGDLDYWIVRISANGEKLWDQSFGGVTNDLLTGTTKAVNELQGVAVNSNGEYLLGGNSNARKSGDKTQDRKGSIDYWVVKIK